MPDLSASLRTAIADAYGANLDRLDLYDADDTLLATIQGVFPAAVAGASSFDPDSVDAVAAGVAAKARAYDADGTDEVSGLTVTATGGGGHVQLVNTNIAAGQPVDLTAYSINVPAAA